MANLGLSFTKYIVFIFNFVFAMIGIAMVGLGIFVRVAVNDYKVFMKGYLTMFPYVLIGIGCIIFVVSFLGCCGAITENTCMLFSFSVLLMGVFVLQVGIGIYAFEKRDQLDGFVQSSLNDTLNSIKDHKEYLAPWDLIQNRFKCCGITSQEDWKSIIGNSNLPPSCCQKELPYQCFKEEASKLGCKKALIDFLNSHIVSLVSIGFGIALFQLLGIVFGCCLFSVFRKNP